MDSNLKAWIIGDMESKIHTILCDFLRVYIGVCDIERRHIYGMGIQKSNG